MPITASAKKSWRVSLRRRTENARTKVAFRESLRKVSASSLQPTLSTIDKAAKAGVIHPNKAARLKSSLMKKFRAPARAQKRPKKASPKSKASKRR